MCTVAQNIFWGTLKFKTYIRYFEVLNKEQKKKVFGVLMVVLKVELLMKSKKSVHYGSFWVILLQGAITFLISLKGAIWKKVWETLLYKYSY